MSSAAPTKRDYATNRLPAGKGLAELFAPIVQSTVGMKAIVAITGLALIGFVIGHMVGHLKMFAGQTDYNKYAHFLKSTGPLLWIARGGLLLIFVLHVLFTIRLVKRSKAARPVPYHYSQTIQASAASRFMFYAGLAMLAFVIFHLVHFTMGRVLGIQALNRETGVIEQVNYLDVVDADGLHDVYSLMVDAFRNPVLSGLYLAALFFLYLHLSHGISSMFQTLGLNTPRTQGFYKVAGQALAVLICLGYASVVVAIWVGKVPVRPTYVSLPPL
jgi:succinate dehydrogenase / fumarate reductase, cytochrome b subunit